MARQRPHPDRPSQERARRDPALEELETQISGCLRVDRLALRRQLKSMRGRERTGRPSDRSEARLRQELSEALRRASDRARLRPTLVFPEALPVVSAKAEIADAIRDHQVVILCGETGSGKTTQLPKICLELGRGRDGLIGHTQPRRIAARSVARRIADELSTGVGGTNGLVGYKVRFGDVTGPSCVVKLMTDGILLAETQGDPSLDRYDTIIIDEAHERSLNIDFLLGYLRQLLPRRPDLKVIITSATIDPEAFSAHFGGAPIIEVPGRSYPVEMLYRPVEPENEDLRSAELRSIVDAARELCHETAGDILVFLSGEREIRETAKALRDADLPRAEILPLYARLSVAEQQRIFKPHKGRRIVLSTNVAETSLTVPGIRSVIDPGTARISRYSARSKVQRLPIEEISQASANQRAGRCGRVGPGTCVRLYSEENYEEREPFTAPEILRTNLASVILQMKSLRLGEVDRFPFVEAPKIGQVRDGYRTLFELGAIEDPTGHGGLTAIGKELAHLPLDPHLGRMIVAARDENALREVLVIASALAVQDPRERPIDARDAADEAHAEFVDDDSDFVTLLNLWDHYHELAPKKSRSALQRELKKRFISYVRMREWIDVHTQLKSMLRERGVGMSGQDAPYDRIHRAILAGLISNIGVRKEGSEYAGAHSGLFYIFPGSGLFEARPQWVVASEVVETTRRYARTVARIRPAWIEAVAPHLLKREYSEPHWDEANAHAAAFERVLIHGLELVSRRRVSYGQVHPGRARQMFLKHALVLGEYRSNAPFSRHNQAVTESVATLGAKLRAEVVAEPEDRAHFFEKIVPPDVHTGSRFERWRKKAEGKNRKLLFMSRDAVLRDDAPDADPALFPDACEIGGETCAIEYVHELGNPADGATLVLSAQGLNGLTQQRLDWLVPGLLRPRIEAMIRALPKRWRASFAPVPDKAHACVQTLSPDGGSLIEQLSAALHSLTEVVVPSGAWDPEAVGPHLRANIRVVQRAGREVRTIAEGRSLSGVRDAVRAHYERHFDALPRAAWERSGVTDWDVGDLSDDVELSHDGVALGAHAALVDAGDSARLTLCRYRDQADALHRFGVRRLLALRCEREIGAQLNHLPGIDGVRLTYATFGDPASLALALRSLIATGAFGSDLESIRTEAAFRARADAGWPSLSRASHAAIEMIAVILKSAGQVAIAMESLSAANAAEAADDLRGQYTRLLAPGFFSTTPTEWLRQYPKYLGAMARRLERFRRGGQAAIESDERQLCQVRPFWNTYLQLEATLPRDDVRPLEVERFRWLIEEFRVSLFAQDLKTVSRVSVERLQKQWLAIKRA